MKKVIAIILVLIGLSSQAQPYLVQSAKWQFKYGQRFDSAFRLYNLPILTGDTVIGFNPYSKKIGLKIISSSNSWSLTGNSPTQSQFLGTNTTNPIRFRVNNNQVGYWDSVGRLGIGVKPTTRVEKLQLGNNSQNEVYINGGLTIDGDYGITANSYAEFNSGVTCNSGAIVTGNDLLIEGNNDVRADGALGTGKEGTSSTPFGAVEFGINQSSLKPKNATGRLWYLPDSSGTLALTSMIPTNYWSTSGNTFSNGNYLGTSNNRGLPIVINGKKQFYFDTLAGVNLYDRNASRILSIYKNNSATTRSGTVYNSRPDSTNSSKSGHIFIADGVNATPAAGTYYSTVAIQQGSLSTSGTGIASSLLIQPSYITQYSGSGYISGITINSGNTMGGGSLYFRGLDIPNCGNNSNSYGIHQADAVGRNYFAASTQFGSTTTSTSAQVQINSTTKGFLPPVMTNAQKNAISSPATGLVVYDNGTNKLNYYNGSSWRGLDSSGGGSYLPLSGGTLTGNLLFTDNTYDIGANGATRPRTGYFGTSIISPAITSTGSLGIVVDNASGDAIIRLSDGFGQGGRITTIGNNGGGELQNYDGSAPSLRWNGGGINIGSSANPIGKLSIPIAPTASSNYGLTSRGNGAFDGSTSGYFTGSANGTVDAINITGSADFANWQKSGVSKFKVDNDGGVTVNKYYVSAMNTAPSSASDTGTLGEIRVTATYIYVCTATNTWVRTSLATW